MANIIPLLTLLPPPGPPDFPYLPASEQPAQRLMDASAEALSDGELLSLVLGNKTPEQSLGLSRRLLAMFGSLRELATVPLSELLKIKGVGKATACAIQAALQMGRRLQQHVGNDKPHLKAPAEVADYLLPVLRDKAQEEMHVLLLDSRHRLLRDVLATIGLADRSQTHAREVFREAIRANCTRIILAHNHPAGDPTPSSQDLECTRGLEAAGKVIGIEVLDHVIIGERTPAHPQPWFSLRTSGLMQSQASSTASVPAS